MIHRLRLIGEKIAKFNDATLLLNNGVTKIHQDWITTRRRKHLNTCIRDNAIRIVVAMEFIDKIGQRYT